MEKQTGEQSLRKTWNEHKPQFDRLKKLAFDLGVEQVVVASASCSIGESGLYIPAWEMECWGGPWTPTREGFEIIENWNLSNRKIQLLNRASGPIILIDYLSQGTHCSTLAHEIGHRLCHITEFRNDEEDAPLTPAMYRLFPNDTYMHKNGQKEFRAECFAEYLTKIDLRNSVERYCDAVLRRLRLKDRNVLSLIEHHRNNLAKY